MANIYGSPYGSHPTKVYDYSADPSNRGSDAEERGRRHSAARTPRMPKNGRALEPSRKPKDPAIRVAGIHVEPHVRTVAAAKKRPLPVSLIFMTAICTVLFMFMIYNMVEINEYTVHVSQLQSQYDTLLDEEKSLNLQLEKRNDLRLIERKATALGMVKLDQVSKQYVIVESRDKIEVVTEDHAR